MIWKIFSLGSLLKKERGRFMVIWKFEGDKIFQVSLFILLLSNNIKYIYNKQLFKK